MESREVLEGIINLWLIKNDLRPGYLANTGTQEDLEIIDKKANDLGLNKFPINEGNIYTKREKIKIDSDKDLGEILGFYCFDHSDYFNNSVDRVSFGITEGNSDIEVFVEVCEASKINIDEVSKLYRGKVGKFNEKSNGEYNFMFKSTYLPSTATLLGIKRYEQFVRFRYEYTDLILNHWFEDSSFMSILENIDGSNFGRSWPILRTFLGNVLSWEGYIENILDMYEVEDLGEIEEIINLDRCLYDLLNPR